MPIDFEWIGRTLRAIQAEQRTIRQENALLRQDVHEAITSIIDRIAAFEAHVDARFDELETRK